MNMEQLVIAMEKYAKPPKGSLAWRGWLDSQRRFVDEWGRPLKLKLEDEGQTITIYSFGKDGIDDGGEHGRNEGGRFHDDWAEVETIGKN